jgi:acyl-CoA synthetase (AMP-forming)/AMP-acid ligase II
MISGDVQTAPTVVLRLNPVALAAGRVALADDGRDIVSCGRVWPRHEVLVVEPETQVPCPAEHIGELWARGPSFSSGYWNQPALSERVLRARLTDGAGPYLRTGDLGFVRDGEVFVVGRISDLIIVRGRNHHPPDLEATVAASHPALAGGLGAAFSIECDGEERLVVVQEVDRHHLRGLDIADVVGAIRQALWRHHELRPAAVELVKPSSLPLTSSGKIQRHVCRARFLARELTSVGRDPPDWP